MSPYIICIIVGALISIIGLCFIRPIIKKQYSPKIIIYYILCTVLGTIFFNVLFTLISIDSLTSYNEFRAFKIVQVQYFEKWNELVTYTVTVDDGKGKSHIEIRTRVDYHGPQWKAIDEINNEHCIDSKLYQYWTQKWHNDTFKNLHRDYYTMNGNEYYSSWTQNFSDIYPWIDVFHYENKIRASSTIFNKWPNVTDSIKDKYKRPADEDNLNPIISYTLKYKIFPEHITLEQQENAFLGKKYQVYPLLILFDGNKNAYESELLMSSWKGPNMNELVTCIGLNSDSSVSWCRTYSWMDNSYLNSTLQQELLNGKFTISKYDRLLFNEVPALWHRKDFKKDFAYITIEMPEWIIILMLLLDIGLNIGALFFLKQTVYD